MTRRASNILPMQSKGVNHFLDELTQLIRQAGSYDTPSEEKEKCYVEMYNAIAELCANNDYALSLLRRTKLEELAKRSSDWYQFVQTRGSGEGDSSGIKEFYHRFYSLGERLEKIIIAFYIDGKIYVVSGNKRVRAHELAIKEGKASLCDIILITPPESQEYAQTALDAQNVATLSNQEDIKARRPEADIDIEHQLRNRFELLKVVEPEMKTWSEERKITWGKSYVKSRGGLWADPSRKSRVSTIANAAFASHRGISIPFPSNDDLGENWQGFFPNDIFEEGSDEDEIRCVATNADISGNLKLTRMRLWETSTYSGRQEMWLILRCGTTKDSSITSIKTLTNQRNIALDKLREDNLKAKWIDSKLPLTTKVVFVKQIADTADEAMAYEWHKQKKDFLQVNDA
jgi:hypothetical protein